MKKLLASLMAVSMLASMATGTFADNFDNVPYFSEEDVIVLDSDQGVEERIYIEKTRKFLPKRWYEVARANNLIYEDVMINIDNLNGADSVHVKVYKRGNPYIDTWLGMDEQYTFDTDWDDGEYSIQFCTDKEATITYRIHTVS